MKKLQTKRTIVVEGRYDAVKLHSIVDANVLTTEGFGIYSNKEKQKLLKRLAKKNGLILLLDADGAGFRLRNYITNLAGEQNVLQLYTPAVKGKEKRKETAGKEGLLGVEGIETKLLYQLLETAIEQDTVAVSPKSPTDYMNSKTEQENAPPETRLVTYTDLFRWGLSGTDGSAARKIAFLQSLGLPPRLSKKQLVDVLNRLYTYQELEEKQQAMFGS